MFARLMQPSAPTHSSILVRWRPGLEQLECRLAPAAPIPYPSVLNAPAPVSLSHVAHAPPAILVILQALRGHGDAPGPASVQVPPPPGAVLSTAPMSVAAPPPGLPLNPTLIALPVEPTLAETPAISGPAEQSRSVDPVAPELVETPRAELVAVAVAPDETAPLLPETSEFHAEPVITCAPSAQPTADQAPRADSVATRDPMPLLVWLVGMSALLALQWDRCAPAARLASRL